ncbi:hypothetical protein HJC23_011235 [Cyclotella cryptica]|uniref:SPRY domain-containing protein n=1 Tax=Cyclotella cryptica TaxID=29204 RepID=A0ABD3QVQ0_9STRA|eukprot:CCRYP_001621-RA/>CCRYP_001621-RA protein AED:0.00 eAED:0.00 QI:262/-1/1/1/-1/1/1/110/502
MTSEQSPSASPPLSIADSAGSSPKNSPPTGQPSSTRNQAAATAAVAAALDATRAHQHLFPGLATVFFENGGPSASLAVYSSSMIPSTDKSNKPMDSLEATSASAGGHPFLPSMEEVSNAALKCINDFPPYVTMNVRDSAPQVTLSDPTPVVEGSHLEDSMSHRGINFRKTVRRLVVRGSMRGYRMSRASHGVSHGCYYYEAVVLGPTTPDTRTSLKRPLHEISDNNSGEKNIQNSESLTSTAQHSNSQTNSSSGHLRMGWSTRLGDLQAPVGYDKHSYAIRDIMGSRVHNSQREDNWGGVEFGPGDVIGFAICLSENATDRIAESASENAGDKKSNSMKTNYICFYKNGVIMGGKQLHDSKTECTGIAFDNISSDTYFPAVSCYLDGSAHLNFGPHFIYPPEGMPGKQKLQPISNLCPPPPTPEDAEEIVISSSNEGRKIFMSKRTDELIVTAFKQLVKIEAAVRREAYLRHLRMHKREIELLRKERGLSTLDLFDCSTISQ